MIRYSIDTTTFIGQSENLQHLTCDLSYSRYRRVGQVDLYQTDAHHPRRRLHGRGQADPHQARVSEHLHGHAEHDQGHGLAQDPVRGSLLPGILLCTYLIFGLKLCLILKTF